MDCAICDPLLDEYVDGLLGGKPRTEVEAHLAICAPCREQVQQLRALTDLLAAHAEPEYAPDFTATVLARTTESAWTWSWAWPAGAAALLSALLVWVAAGLRPLAPPVLQWAEATLHGLGEAALKLVAAALPAIPSVVQTIAPSLLLACGLCLVLAAGVALCGRRVWTVAQAARVLAA